jgi:two-component system, NarL family, sensor histidine kinase DesK
VTTVFWTPKTPSRAMVALILAVAAIAPVDTSLGSPGLAGRAPYAPVACGAALAALQVRTSYAASRGERPRWAWPTLLVMAAIAYMPMYWYAQNWWATLAMLGASALMLVPHRRLAVVLAAAPVISVLGYFAWNFLASYPEYRAYVTLDIDTMAWWAISLTCGVTALYGAARLVRVASELQDARTELAELAITQERLRVSRNLHDLAGQSLTAISLRGDLALALLDRDREAARAEMATLTATARNALHDVLTVTRDGAAVDLRTEAEGARALLAAAGIETVVHLGDEGIPPGVRTVFAWALREGVTNVLRHSEATTCMITASRHRLEIINDGVGSRTPGAGSGLTGLAERARAFSGRVTSGPAGDGRFQLVVEFP